MPLPQVQNLVDTRLAQKISQLPGVGLVTLSGGQRPRCALGESARARGERPDLEDVRTGDRLRQRQPGKGQLPTARAAPTRSTANDQLRSRPTTAL